MELGGLQGYEEKQALCDRAREFIGRGAFAECEQMLCDALSRFPHAPEPHNLLGILLETQRMHPLAMAHFRAAWALDPRYRPVRQNLDNYASLNAIRPPAFDDSDCRDEPPFAKTSIVIDAQGAGQVKPLD